MADTKIKLEVGTHLLDEQFASAFQLYPCLYDDMKCAEYIDRNVKNNALEELKKQFNFPSGIKI